MRVIVFLALSPRARTAREIAEVLDRPLGTVAYHLRVLVDLGVVDEVPADEDEVEEVPLKDL